MGSGSDPLGGAGTPPAGPWATPGGDGGRRVRRGSGRLRDLVQALGLNLRGADPNLDPTVKLTVSDFEAPEFVAALCDPVELPPCFAGPVEVPLARLPKGQVKDEDLLRTEPLLGGGL